MVVKIGTQALCDAAGRLDTGIIEGLASDIASLQHERGVKAALVSSGAIGAGVAKMDLPKRPRDLPMLQATAAVGQSLLMNLFSAAFAKHNLHAGQILVTRDDFENRLRYLNLRNCIHALQACNAVPITSRASGCSEVGSEAILPRRSG